MKLIMKKIIILGSIFLLLSCHKKYDCVCDEGGYQTVSYLGKISNNLAKVECQEQEDFLKEYHEDTIVVECYKGLSGLAD